MADCTLAWDQFQAANESAAAASKASNEADVAAAKAISAAEDAKAAETAAHADAKQKYHDYLACLSG